MKKAIIVVGLLSIGMFAACAATTPQAVVDARNQYNAATSDATVARYSPGTLQQAKDLVERAEGERDVAEAEHLAYLATQKIEVAKLDAKRETMVTGVQSSRAKEQQVMADMIRELSELKAEQTTRGTVLTIGDALFETGKAELKPGAKMNLDKIAMTLKANPKMQVLIEGHTDNQGSNDLNQRLSQQRAEAVAYYLKSRGVDAKRIIAKGHGKEFPVASNDTEAGRQQNRRVEIVMIPEGANVKQAMR